MTSFLPVFTNDWLLDYRPFPDKPSNVFEEHWHEVVLSLLFYGTIHLLSPFVMSRWMGSHYTTLPKRTRVNFDVHVVSMVQCFISIASLAPMWNHSHWQNRLNDPKSSIEGSTPYGSFVAAITVGYFVWDVIVCTVYFLLFGLGFLVHGLAALYVFSFCMRPYAQPWIPAFLLFELSTPFVNINWFASKLPAGVIGSKTFIINGLCLLFTFFTVRILWGFYAVTIVARDMFAVWNDNPKFLPVTILGLNVTLDVLNVFWFQKMVKIATKKARGSTSTRAAAKETAQKIE